MPPAKTSRKKCASILPDVLPKPEELARFEIHHMLRKLNGELGIATVSEVDIRRFIEATEVIIRRNFHMWSILRRNGLHVNI